MGTQYPDLYSNPQKLLIHVSLWATIIGCIILASFQFQWIGRLDFCDELLHGTPAIVTKLALYGGSISVACAFITLLCMIYFYALRCCKSVTTKDMVYSSKISIIINSIFALIASVLGIALSIFGLNHEAGGLCDKYLSKGIDINIICTKSRDYPDYSKQTLKMMIKIAEDPGYYCEKVGIPCLILSIVNIALVIISLIGYIIGKKHMIEESSVNEGNDIDEEQTISQN